MFTRRLPLLLALGILIMGSMGFLVSTDDDVEAVGTPVISIMILSRQTAYVAPGQDGFATFNGTVYVEAPWSPDIQSIIVQLGTDAGDWSVTTPPAMEFTKGVTEQDFAITVQVPIGTSHMIEGTLTISGTWRYSPGVTTGTIDDITAHIDVAQYFDCDLDTSTPSLEAEKGGRAEFIVDAINNGNANDEMTIEILNLDHLVSEGINIQLSDHVVAVPEQQSREITITASVHDGASIGGYTITVHVSSKLAEELGKPCDTDTIDLYLEVVRVIEKPEEPEVDPEQEEPQGGPEVPQEEPDNGEDIEEVIEEDPTYTQGEESVPSLGIFGILFSICSVLIIIKRVKQ